MGIPVVEALSLSEPISKRRMLSQGYFQRDIERKYAATLMVDAAAADYRRILVVDDVSTRGSTFKCAYDALRRSGGGTAGIGCCSAGLMIVTETVESEAEIVALCSAH